MRRLCWRRPKKHQTAHGSTAALVLGATIKTSMWVNPNFNRMIRIDQLTKQDLGWWIVNDHLGEINPAAEGWRLYMSHEYGDWAWRSESKTGNVWWDYDKATYFIQEKTEAGWILMAKSVIVPVAPSGNKFAIRVK